MVDLAKDVVLHSGSVGAFTKPVFPVDLILHDVGPIHGCWILVIRARRRAPKLTLGLVDQYSHKSLERTVNLILLKSYDYYFNRQ